MKSVMNDRVFLEKGYAISDDKRRIDFDLVYNFLSCESYWANGIPRETVQTSMENSLCFSVFYRQNQVGFARVVTDKATFAYLADLFIVSEHRKQGLSKWLVQTILAHESLRRVRRIMLITSDAQGLYKQFGFAVADNPERIMAIKKSYIVK